ncbi:aminotransferase class V-fold PLP-dependent enzyme [Herbiconiux sp. L3-i23]|uniref:pyridoxal phosphate-dependent decarboxylase family protein n=1 Tax=Herbiconiux sp. L3-i23 TaxID=2905871 RepID=UPI00205DC12F|nr:aminotransferase class V-fold PLP-dependent enzyme [Herbiconiux sp. L3-i23]BDI22230.1 L-2,4-diaminobutyrate decarboxylase [Herbiconiux sp. L3-i23]
MNGRENDLTAIDDAVERALDWLSVVPTREVPSRLTPEEVIASLGDLSERGRPAPEVIDSLDEAVRPGLMASGSGRFFGWVMGATLPVAIGADWLVTAWDQNAGMRDSTPGVVGVEETAARWLLDLLGLPEDSAVGFTTGATMANFTGLAAARGAVLSRLGWDVETQGLIGAPPVRVLVGEERHGSIDLALRYLGLGRAETVRVDDQGRIDVADLASRLAEPSETRGGTIVCLQAGNIHSGAFDDFAGAVEAAHRHGAWVHVDGAFGLWAAVVPDLADLTAGLAGADSWATDAHKTLNTPYDCGISVVADAKAALAATSSHASYLLTSSRVDPHELVPEMSRRARGVPVWAALAYLGRDGVRNLVAGLVEAARGIADGISAIPGTTVLNDVVYTQVSATFGDRTGEVFGRIIEDGTIMPSASVWHGQPVIRFSVSSWRTGTEEVAQTVRAVRTAAEGADVLSPVS